MSREAMRLALWTLEGWANYDDWVWPESALEQAKRNTIEAITALEQALEEKQEPRPCKVGSACVPTENGSCACSQLMPSTNSVVTQTEQDPVAWIDQRIHGWPDCFVMQPDPPHTVPLYTAPPKREWVGLTDEEIAKVIHGSVEDGNMFPYQFAKTIEQALKEKNT